jgi:hypothetical protein
LSCIINAGSDHTPYKLLDKSLFGFHRWKSPKVESSVVGVGWALPTISRWDQRYLVGTAHPTIRNFRNLRDNTIYFVAENLVLWARSETIGYAMNPAASGSGMMEYWNDGMLGLKDVADQFIKSDRHPLSIPNIPFGV